MYRSVITRSVERCNLIYVPRRTAKFELPFKWDRPEKVPIWEPEKAGDLKPLEDLDLKKILLPQFEKSKELQTADENVKKLFTLEFQSKNVLISAVKKHYVDSVKRHELDNDSPEAAIASLTASIRHMQKYISTLNGKKPPRRIRLHIRDLVVRRAERLSTLRLQDYKLFEWLLERLDLVHKPPPANGVEPVQRKRSLRKLTDIYCEALKQERLDQYRDHLEMQQEEFLEKKLETLQWIQNKEKEYNLRSSVTDEDIENVKKQLEEVKLQERKTTVE